ncbi:MAG: carboxylating nicotinate-nucleotide diphosphorylase [Planctomycetota bacterium]|nr:MAG: carboxylating nicotinate-nucleotide diphosphorylase [Planctomycetota bacterium]
MSRPVPIDGGSTGESTARRGAPSAAPAPLSRELVDERIDAALREDLGGDDYRAGDVTTDACVPRERRAVGTLLAKEPGRLAGLDVFCRVFERIDAAVASERAARDGDVLAAGQRVARVSGPAWALLAGERTALNFVQRLSGIATQAARWVELAGSRARILDTRKTTPGLRALEKYAVRCGGATNHRFALYDEVLVKDNHVDLAGCAIEELLPRVRARVGASMRITCEARTASEAAAAVDGGADVVLLDNFTPAELSALVPTLASRARARGGRRVELEASGGIDERNLRAYADAGVDRISIGALTHSVRALDLSFKLEPLA